MSLINVDKNFSNKPIIMNRSHEHKFYEFYFLLKGTRFFSVGEYTCKVQSNDILIVAPNQPHLTNGGPFERYTLNIFPEVLTEEQTKFIETLIEKQPISVSPSVMERIKFCLEDIISILNMPDYQKKSNLIFSYILFLIENNLSANKLYSTNKLKIPIYLYKTIDYINENLDKDLSISAISQYINFSPDYLRKQFKFYMKQSLYDYILTVKLDKVKAYLWNTHYPINKIAKLCGFSSGNYLTLIFTKKEKISPSKYRKIRFPLQ